MAFIVENITASGIQIPDLAGITIDPYESVDLGLYFTIDMIDDSLDLDALIEEDKFRMNDGTTTLSKEESLDHTRVESAYETIKYFLDLADTPTTFSGFDGKYVGIDSSSSGIEFRDIDSSSIYNYIDTISGTMQNQVSYLTNISHTFGLDFIYGIDDTTYSTTSTTYGEAFSLTVSGSAADEYRIGWGYEWNMSNSNFTFFSRIQVDDTAILSESNQRPPNSDSWNQAAGVMYITLASGIHHIDIDYKSGSTGKAANIRNLIIEFWRV